MVRDEHKRHWEEAYADGPADVSWYQSRPDTSLAYIAATEAPSDGGIIDVGGGASTLVDHLLDHGYSKVAVLDISRAALDHARARLGERAAAVEWIEADVTAFEPPRQFAVWHDRAVFHFLTTPADRRSYVATLSRALSAEGQVVLATFALDGPAKCSGLEVVRYDEISIAAELGPDFVLRASQRETHKTPWGTEQRFQYFRFQRKPC